jgi:tetratricopeptide (TPR) repeat protein
MLGKSPRNWHLAAVLVLGAAVLLACGNSGRQLVGSWKGTGEMGYNQDLADFLDDGSCKFLRSGQRVFCSWNKPVGGDLKVKLDADHPENDLRVVIDGDQMWLMQGDQTESAWVRSGTPLDGSVATYTKGQSLIQAGDFENGQKALKEAADRGFLGAQNSLAWTYATARDPRFQDGKQAIAYAEKAVSQLHHYQHLDTLAAALARDGQYKKAAETETEALSLLEKDTTRPDADREAAEERFRKRIELYQGGQPYTEE